MSFSTPTRTSSAIILIRPVLILMMMMAHLFAFNDQLVLREASDLNFANWLTVFLKKALAKSGVPLLSLISGYLAVYSLEKYGYFRLLYRKAKRLVWPLVWANLVYIVLITYPTQAVDPNFRPDLDIYPFNPYGWFQATFAFYRLPANEPLYFLKDLFTCFLLLPLLFLAARIRYLNLLVILWMAWKTLYVQSAFIFEVYPLWFMRFDIVFAFFVGIVLFIERKPLVIERQGISRLLAAMFLAVSIASTTVYVMLPMREHPELYLWLDFLVKLSSVIGCIGLMSLLNDSEGLLSRGLKWLSPCSYSMFLTHAITFWFFHKAWYAVFGPPTFLGPSGFAYLLLIFVFGVSAAVLLRQGWGLARSRIPIGT
jgi:peptidoglycan/LPS O-acetylase OafA/YrhL